MLRHPAYSAGGHGNEPGVRTAIANAAGDGGRFSLLAQGLAVSNSPLTGGPRRPETVAFRPRYSTHLPQRDLFA